MKLNDKTESAMKFAGLKEVEMAKVRTAFVKFQRDMYPDGLDVPFLWIDEINKKGQKAHCNVMLQRTKAARVWNEVIMDAIEIKENKSIEDWKKPNIILGKSFSFVKDEVGLSLEENESTLECDLFMVLWEYAKSDLGVNADDRLLAGLELLCQENNWYENPCYSGDFEVRVEEYVAPINKAMINAFRQAELAS